MFYIGQKVRPVEEADIYTVTQITNDYIIAVDGDGFAYEFLTKEVVPHSAENLLSFKLEQDARYKLAADQTEKKSQPHIRNQKKSYVEYDLHAGVLLGSTAGMSNHEILTEQLAFAKEMLEKARRNNDMYVVLIHGKGKGRLRSELHKLLAGMDKLDFYDADFRTYNLGATEVHLR
jgi:hypothetical protein